MAGLVFGLCLLVAVVIGAAITYTPGKHVGDEAAGFAWGAVAFTLLLGVTAEVGLHTA